MRIQLQYKEAVGMSAIDYQRIEKSIQYLEEHFREQPDLKRVAAHVHLSEFHFQRLFTRWAGISPKRFLQFLTLQYAKDRLQESQSILDATYAAGLSSPGRLHDLFVSIEAMTPGEFKKNGCELDISYGFHESPFGECLLAVTSRGVCGFEFVAADGRSQHLETLMGNWKTATFRRDDRSTRPVMRRILDVFHGGRSSQLALLLKGTNFQIKVWHALLRIPPGTLVSYEDVAAAVCGRSGSRAVGRAVGRNPIALLIPCHRVIRKIGAISGYRWGTARKQALIGWEAARRLTIDD